MCIDVLGILLKRCIFRRLKLQAVCEFLKTQPDSLPRMLRLIFQLLMTGKSLRVTHASMFHCHEITGIIKCLLLQHLLAFTGQLPNLFPVSSLLLGLILLQQNEYLELKQRMIDQQIESKRSQYVIALLVSPKRLK